MFRRIILLKSVLLLTICIVLLIISILLISIGWIRITVYSLEGAVGVSLLFVMFFVNTVFIRIMDIKEGMHSSLIEKILINENGIKIYNALDNQLISSCKWDQIINISIKEFELYRLKIFTAIVLDHKQEKVFESEYNKNLLNEILLYTKYNENKIGKIRYQFKGKQGFIKI